MLILNLLGQICGFSLRFTIPESFWGLWRALDGECLPRVLGDRRSALQPPECVAHRHDQVVGPTLVGLNLPLLGFAPHLRIGRRDLGVRHDLFLLYVS